MSCPTPNKRKFTNRKQAKGAIKSGGAGEKLKPYYCDGCYQWHLTSITIVPWRLAKYKKWLTGKNWLVYGEEFKKFMK